MNARLRRSAVLLFVLSLFPNPGSATMIPPITAPPASLALVNAVQNQNSCQGNGTDTGSGSSATSGTSLTMTPHSPGLYGAPVYNSFQRTVTPWGLGWSDDLDQYLMSVSSATIAWTQTVAAQRILDTLLLTLRPSFRDYPACGAQASCA
jgi:hypothetical protein